MTSVSGITPAPAGNTTTATAKNHLAKDYPRTCGEHIRKFSPLCAVMGLPPHLRGTQFGMADERNTVGITPAPAGNTYSGDNDIHYW
ncbi:hypothetical protein FD19_GL001140 [Lacticaseibacillus thailandensis DSM 22698 = JCM 13996]|uniref:Uncharacterized protein n=1 Tax=Lacticaseibacillus thailandensis DSM 22698 = JCM 13996 TaxID=1423810 RepID=A0A0R2CHX8_9LACO|nr:hypothetical protein FD19_GL001140 [Lacticaseibacillus thailandensis DSM 22698 = JCM 13996]